MDKKHSLIRLIISAGLEEEFIEQLKQQGYKDLYGRLDNIPIEVIENFVREKKLLYDEDDLRELVKDIDSTEYYEVIEKRTKSRKL